MCIRDRYTAIIKKPEGPRPAEYEGGELNNKDIEEERQFVREDDNQDGEMMEERHPA